jgi:hypothetical protein
MTLTWRGCGDVARTVAGWSCASQSLHLVGTGEGWKIVEVLWLTR